MKSSRIAPLFAVALVIGLTACQSSTVEPPSVNGQWEQQGVSYQACDSTPAAVNVGLTILQEGSDLTGTLQLTEEAPGTLDVTLAFEGQLSISGSITGIAVLSSSTSSDIVAVDLALTDGILDGTVRGGSGCEELFVIDVELAKA